jgi:phospholipid/cholesterol/gamma-HCH transport system ATP-binding protein
MVFQGSALFDSMTVAEKCCFPLKCSPETIKQNQRTSRFCFQRVALLDAHNKLPSEILGMQKVAIARAIKQT